MLSCLHAFIKHVRLPKINFEQFGDFEAIFESGNLMGSELKEGIKKSCAAPIKKHLAQVWNEFTRVLNDNNPTI
jgi:hypothetical protein